MKSRRTAMVMVLACGCGIFLCGAAIEHNAWAEPLHTITLPAETAVLRNSELPGYAIASAKCGLCHSADYVNLQPPGMSVTQWTAEVTKMQRAFGAPIEDGEVEPLANYLAAAYAGDAK